MHSKEPSVLVQMPLWQRSSSLHSSTSAGQGIQNPDPPPPLSNTSGHTPSLPPSQPFKFQSLKGRPHPICSGPLFLASPTSSRRSFPVTIPAVSVQCFLTHPAASRPPKSFTPSGPGRFPLNPQKNPESPFCPLPLAPPFPAVTPLFPYSDMAWGLTQTRCSTRSRPIARGTGTGKGAVGVEALSMGEAEVAFQTLIYI